MRPLGLPLPSVAHRATQRITASRPITAGTCPGGPRSPGQVCSADDEYGAAASQELIAKGEVEMG